MAIPNNLRNIVRYNDLVRNLDMHSVSRDIDILLRQISTDLATNDYDNDKLKESMGYKHQEILKILQNWNDDLNSFKKNLKKTVDEYAKPYYEKSKIVYEHNCKLPRLEKLSRLKDSDLLYNEESKKILISRIRNNVSAGYACCQIQPGYGEITKEIVAGTPLYIMEEEDFPSVVNTDFFNEIMTKRINWYSYHENHDDPMHKLPQGQIGCFIVVDFFNSKTVEVIQKYLKSIYTALRPGGVVIFTYNNCDYPKGLDKVDDMYYCYTTEEEMTALCEEVGYKLVDSVTRGYDELDNGISWLEIKKPGELTTIRAGQGLAQIMDL